MLNVGLIGVGHLGKIHLKCIQNLPQYALTGFLDTDIETSKYVSATFNIHSYDNVNDLLMHNDVIDIVTPTINHYEYAKIALKHGKHVFIEKPVVATMKEAKDLLSLVNKSNNKLQIGHVERFNPAFVAAQHAIKEPLFIEVHRLSEYTSRGTDVSVVFDLMVHDLDIILSIVKSKIKQIKAKGINIISDTTDIANVRIDFENGATANITASRMSLEKVRKFRIFQKDEYISIDFLNKKTDIISIKDNPNYKDPNAIIVGNKKKSKQIIIENLEIINSNAIQAELAYFHDVIINDSKPIVSINEGIAALSVANKIDTLINKANKYYNNNS